MKNVIVYLSQVQQGHELTEYFHNLGYEPLFTDKRANLLIAYGKQMCSQVYLEISNFSDILLINSIKEINSEARIVLMVEPALKDIMSVLQNSDYPIINSILHVSSSEQIQ